MAKKKTDDELVNVKEEKKVKKASSKEITNLSELFSEIEKRSFEIYLDRKAQGLSGSDMDDWLQAEKEIKEKYGLK